MFEDQAYTQKLLISTNQQVVASATEEKYTFTVLPRSYRGVPEGRHGNTILVALNDEVDLYIERVA